MAGINNENHSVERGREKKKKLQKHNKKRKILRTLITTTTISFPHLCHVQTRPSTHLGRLVRVFAIAARLASFAQEGVRSQNLLDFAKVESAAQNVLHLLDGHASLFHVLVENVDAVFIEGLVTVMISQGS